MAERLNDLDEAGAVLDPKGRVRTVVYSSGAIGRLEPDPVFGMMEIWRT